MSKNKCQRRDRVKRQNVLLSLRASNLKNNAGLLKGISDPFAVVTLLGENLISTPRVLGKTEVIKNSLNPLWTKAYLLDYVIGKPMYINVSIYHEVQKTQKHKPMGSAVFEIGEILGLRGNVKAKKLKTGGSLIARVETAPAQSSGDLTITLQGAQLKNVELIGKADPFFEVSRMDGLGGSAWLPVLRSKHIENDLNPMWEAATIDLNRLCDGDEERPIKISVFDYEKSGKHRPIGSFETSLNDLVSAKISGNAGDSVESFVIVEKGKETGRIFVADISIRRDGTNVSSVVSKDNDNEKSSPIGNDVRDEKYLNICLQGMQLKNMEFGGKSDPFYEISRRINGPGGNKWLPVHRSKHIENDLSPIWEDATIDLDRLCDGDKVRPILVSVFDYEKSGHHKPMGSFNTNVAGLVAAKISGNDDTVESFALMTKGKETGRVFVADASLLRDAATTANVVRDDKYLNISLQGVKLKNVEFGGKSDPFFELSRRINGPSGKAWLPVIRSKYIENNLNPVWEHVTIDLDRLCDGDREKAILVSVFDYEKSGKHRPMGSFLINVAGLVMANINTRNDSVGSFSLMKKGKEMGRIFVADAFFSRDGNDNVSAISQGNESSETGKLPLSTSANEGQDDEFLNITLQGVRLTNMEITGKSDPFFELSRRIEHPTGSVKLRVFRSEHITNDLDPKWEPAAIDLNRLCDGDKDKPITVSVSDYERSGNHKEMGSFETTVNKLLERVSDKPNDISKSFVLVRNGKRMGRIVVTDALIKAGTGCSTDNYIERDEIVTSKSAPAEPQVQDVNETESAGSVEVSDGVGTEQTSLTKMDDDTETKSSPFLDAPPSMNLPRPSFLDYISGGCELQICVAIDFGESNGNPQVPGTLHYIHDDGKLNDYEKAISAVGSILANYDSDQRFPVWGFGARFCGKLQNCFQVGFNAEAHGIEGIIENYREMSKSSLCMSSPSLITEVIEKAAYNSIMSQEAARNDGNQCYTILLILTSGAIDYTDATKDVIAVASVAPLSIVIVGVGDADFGEMQYLDNFAQEQKGSVRDITQFVEFRAHQDDKNSLRRAILEEIPDQLVEYFYSRGMLANPILSGNKLQIEPGDYNKETDINLGLKFDTDGKIAVEAHKSTKDDAFNGMVDKIRTSLVSSMFRTSVALPGKSIKDIPGSLRRTMHN